jgi:hypothetical protein
LYTYFRVDFTAADAESGVHKIGFSIIVTSGNQKPRKTYEGFIPAAMSDVSLACINLFGRTYQILIFITIIIM